MRGIALGLALVAVIGCSSESPDAPRDGGAGDASADAVIDAPVDAGHDAGPIDPVDPESFFAAANAELCRVAVMCEPRSHEDATRSQWYCHPAYRSRVQESQARAFAAERIGFDVEAARACIAEYRAIESCWTFDTSLAAPVDRTRCDEVFPPLVPIGGRCSEPLAAECGDLGTIACNETDADAGVCSKTCVPRATAGEPCAALGDCVLDLRCLDGVCRPPATEGEPCADDLTCGLGLVCVSGTCTATAHGDICSRDLPCSFPQFCMPQRDGTERCTNPDLTSNGDPCVYYHYLDSCPRSLVCAPTMRFTSGGFGFCADGAPAGDACDDATPCALSHRCAAGVCIPVVMPGEACGPGVACPFTHDCDGTCQPLPMLGEPCDWSGRCFEGMCVDRQCRLAPFAAECFGREWTPFTTCQSGVCSGNEMGFCREFTPSAGTCTLPEHCAPAERCERICDSPECVGRCVPNCT